MGAIGDPRGQAPMAARGRCAKPTGTGMGGPICRPVMRRSMHMHAHMHGHPPHARQSPHANCWPCPVLPSPVRLLATAERPMAAYVPRLPPPVEPRGMRAATLFRRRRRIATAASGAGGELAAAKVLMGVACCTERLPACAGGSGSQRTVGMVAAYGPKP
eukprot:349759-Chlamydomonas_euryale.AAC.9